MPQYSYDQPVVFNYANISTDATTTTVVKSSPGTLQATIINSATADVQVSIYDSTTGSGTLIAQYTIGASVTSPAQAVVYGIGFKTGLTIVTTGAYAINMTVVYR